MSRTPSWKNWYQMGREPLWASQSKLTSSPTKVQVPGGLRVRTGWDTGTEGKKHLVKQVHLTLLGAFNQWLVRCPVWSPLALRAAQCLPGFSPQLSPFSMLVFSFPIRPGPSLLLSPFVRWPSFLFSRGNDVLWEEVPYFASTRLTDLPCPFPLPYDHGRSVPSPAKPLWVFLSVPALHFSLCWDWPQASALGPFLFQIHILFQDALLCSYTLPASSLTLSIYRWENWVKKRLGDPPVVPQRAVFRAR